eukprot:gene41243-54646_t
MGKKKNKKPSSSSELPSVSSVASSAPPPVSGSATPLTPDSAAAVGSVNIPPCVTENVGTEILSAAPQQQLTFQANAVVSIIIPKADVDNLINQRNAVAQENEILKFRLNQLLSEKSDSMNTISQKDREIQQRDKVIQQRDIEIEELRRENEDLKWRIKNLEDEIATQGKEIEKLKVMGEFEKFLVVIQDLNSRHSLEGKCIALKKLRYMRVSAFHYITNEDSQQLVDYKAEIAIFRLNQVMTPGCEALFVKKFGSSFLSDLKKTLAGVVSSPQKTASLLAQDEMSEADDWWD